MKTKLWACLFVLLFLGEGFGALRLEPEKSRLEKNAVGNAYVTKKIPTSSETVPGYGGSSRETVLEWEKHRYLYANSSPISFSDPTGEMTIAQMQAAIITVGILVKITAPKIGGALSKVNPRVLIQGAKDTHVYIGLRDNIPVYVGISKDVVRRALEHGGRFTIKQITTNPLYRRQARAIEQFLIEKNPHFENIKASIAKTRDWYDDAIEWAKIWLYKNGGDSGL